MFNHSCDSFHFQKLGFFVQFSTGILKTLLLIILLKCAGFWFHLFSATKLGLPVILTKLNTVLCKAIQ